MTLQSKIAFAENEHKRASDKEQIILFLKTFKDMKFTYIDLSKYTGISIGNCQKRLSDLNKDGMVSVVGECDKHSLYAYKPTRPSLTKTEAFETAIKEICPGLFDLISLRVRELV